MIFNKHLYIYNEQYRYKSNNLKFFQMRQGNPIGHVVNPYVVGGAIIALKCKQGIVIGSDTLLSYGGLLKYTDICRFEKITDNVVIAASGQYADFQQVTRRLKKLAEESDIYDDDVKYSPKDFANYLSHICYQKRNKFNPYFNNIAIAGFQNNEAYLASVDLYGSLIKKDYIATGFAKHFGLALIANEWNPEKTADECREIIRKCFTVIYLRDCHSIENIQISTVTKDGVNIFEPEKINTDKWGYKEFRQRANEKLWQ